MAVVQYKLEYGATYATATNVATNVQNVTVNIGRRAQTDQYGANTATVTMRYPDGYNSPNSFFITDNWVVISVRLGTTGTYYVIFTGRISDVEVQYGIPYVGVTGNADYVTLFCEGLFAAFGRAQGNNYAMTANNLASQTFQCSTQTNLTLNNVFTGLGPRQAYPATTVSSTWGDWVNRILLTSNGRYTEVGDIMALNDQYKKYTPVYGGFSDTTNDATNHSYEKIGFTSLADNYYTQVTVTPESFGAATVQTGAAPYRTYAVNTLNASTAQATNNANMLLAIYKTPAMRISSITCNLNAQIGDIPAYGCTQGPVSLTVLLRGTTYKCVLEGSTFSGTPESASATFYVSAFDLNNFFVLDDTTYGTLDNNRMGYT